MVPEANEMKVEWEKIESKWREGTKHGFGEDSGTVYRAKVLGGWFVVWWNNLPVGGPFFYPDPKHEWDGNSLP